MKMKMKFMVIAIALFIFLPFAAGVETPRVKIVDLFSNIDGCDVTIQGRKAENLSLNFELIFEDKVIDMATIEIESIEANEYYTYFISWNATKEEGAYTARVELKSNYEAVESTHFNFTYGRAALPRFHVADLLADSTGVYVLIKAFEPVMVDVDLYLIDSNRSIYSVKEKNLAFIEFTSLNKNWKIILENNKQYTAMVKLHSYKPQMTIAYTKWFTARDNAIITDVYADRTGVSATIQGKSQVPLRGTVQFEIMQDGRTIEIIQKPSPYLLLDEEKTVEALWKKQLNAGLYDVKVKLFGNDGDILYQYDKVIEVESIATKLSPSPTKQASALTVPLTILAIFIAFRLLQERCG